MKMWLRSAWHALLPCILFVAIPVGAQTLNNNYRILDLEHLWEWDGAQQVTHTTWMEREILTAAGVEEIGKQSVWVNQDIEQAEILEAWTLKADGRKIAVPAENISTQTGALTAGLGASWPGVQIRQIVFPDVQVGDRIATRIRYTRYQTELPGWLSFSQTLPPAVAIRRMQAIFRAPVGSGLQVFSQGMLLDSKEEAGMQIWRAQTSQPARLVDSNIANSGTTWPRLYVSTLKNHEQLAKAYAQGHYARLQPHEEVQAIVKALIQKKTTPQQKASAIYDWIRSNMRYVAVYLGTGGYVPHDLDWILKNRFGDCKDLALLLQAMLQVAGIPSGVALVNLSNEFQLPELPVSSSFNHAIVYIPSLNIFVDATVKEYPLGTLPMRSMDKPVVVAFQNRTESLRTPAIKAENNRVYTQTRIRVATNGDAEIDLSLNTTGDVASYAQTFFSQIRSQSAQGFVQKLLSTSGYSGTGSVQTQAMTKNAQTHRVTLQLKVERFLNDPEVGSIEMLPGIKIPLWIADLFSAYSSPERLYDWACLPMIMEEAVEVVLPPVYQVMHLPGDMNLQEASGIRYQANYRRQGNTFFAKRTFSADASSHVCRAADYAQRRKTMITITRNARSGLLYQARS